MMLHNNTKFHKKNVLWFRRYHPHKTFTNILNLHCDHNLECSNHAVLPQVTLAYDVVLSNQVWLQMDQNSADIAKIVIFSSKVKQKLSFFGYISPCCGLDIEDSQPILFMTLHLIIHHHTKFG